MLVEMTISASAMKLGRYVGSLSGIIRYINITSFLSSREYPETSHLFGWQRVIQSFIVSAELELHIKTVIRNFFKLYISLFYSDFCKIHTMYRCMEITLYY